MKYVFDKIKINPDKPLKNVGFAGVKRESEKSIHDLWMRMFHMQDDVDVFLITLDNLGVSNTVYEKMVATIQQIYKNAQVIISCTHTHYAPSLADLGVLFEVDEHYCAYVLNQLTTLIQAKLKPVKELKIAYGQQPYTSIGKSRNGAYDDRYIQAQMFMLFETDQLLGRFLIYNCHPTTLLSDPGYCTSEYPGVMLEQFDENEPDVFHMFFQGACGEISTRYTRNDKSMEQVETFGNMLYQCYMNMKTNMETIEQFQLKIQKLPLELDFQLPQNDQVTLKPQEQQVFEQALALRKQIEKSKNAFFDVVYLAQICINKHKISFFPCEIFSQYYQYTNKEDIIVGYSNGYFAYVSLPDNPNMDYERVMEIVGNHTKKAFATFLK